MRQTDQGWRDMVTISRHTLDTEDATQAAYPRDTALHQLIEAQVERSPEAIAVIYKAYRSDRLPKTRRKGDVTQVMVEEAYLTYAELNRKSNQLAHYLQKLGVGPEVRVGIYLERSLEMMVGMLGILKAGGAYLPLDPASPQERLSFISRDAQVSIVLSQQRLSRQWATQEIQFICIDTDWQAIAQEPEESVKGLIQPANLAYVIYTSGSTGTPKGTMISHQSLVNYLSWCTKAYMPGEGHGAPVHSSIGFDLTITSLFVPLIVGQSAVVLADTAGIKSLANVLRSEPNFSFVKITPSHLAVLNHMLPADSMKSITQALILGGEALMAEDIALWRTHAPSVRLINEYGPTETVVGCCVYEIPSGASLSGPVPIGYPIANTYLYILDSYLTPVTEGAVGEIYIGGDGLARGYLNRPELTAERFLPDPFARRAGARLYRTGDLARYLPSRAIEFLGRIDGQIKIRGFRIEPGEIEMILQEHPAVREAVVIAREDHPGDKRLVAYIVTARQDDIPSASLLRSHLQSRLPDYMLPTTYFRLESLPLTANGKLDRRALPAPQEHPSDCL